MHLHRLNGSKGYRDGNCVLMHEQCHRDLHSRQVAEAEAPAGDAVEAKASGVAGVLTKWSKRYEDKPFLYWWDVSPGIADRLDDLEAIEFACKDTGERCIVPAGVLKMYLTPERQTSTTGSARDHSSVLLPTVAIGTSSAPAMWPSLHSSNSRTSTMWIPGCGGTPSPPPSPARWWSFWWVS